MSAALDRFAAHLANPNFGLAEASLMIAEDAYPRLDIPATLDELDAIAAAVRAKLAADAFPEQRVVALNACLFGDLGFSGNVDDYYDPRNSYLNEVLARRTGIPITLSILYLEVGRRIGLPLEGVSFPGHFLVKLKVRRGQLVLDPFMGGEPQSEDALRARLAQVLPGGMREGADPGAYLEAATPRQIVARLLRNLKAIYLDAGKPERALEVMNRMLIVAPDSPAEQRDRGAIYQTLECFRPALADFEAYLRRAPDAPDALEIREKLIELGAAVSRLN